MAAPLSWLLFRWCIVKPYELVLRYKRWLNRFPEKLTPAYLLRLPHSVSVLAIMLGMAVITNSYAVRSLEAENFGQSNLIYPLITSLGLDSLAESQAGTGEPVPVPTDVPITISESGAVILKPYFVTTKPGRAGRNSIEQYTVRQGDTLSEIADQFGLNINTVLWENRLNMRSTLRLGQVLNILPIDGVSYRIGRGDTAAKIAQRYKIPVNEVLSFNQLNNSLTVGQTIVIPNGKPITQNVIANKPKSAPSLPSVKKTTLTPAPADYSTQLLWPTTGRRISQYFSWRHTGIDIPQPTGSPVYAAEDGIVEVSGWNGGGYGYYVIVDHGGGMRTLYAHNSKLLVTIGDRVNRGEVISLVGNTGRSTGPHVHFEVRLNGRQLNPLNYTR